MRSPPHSKNLEAYNSFSPIREMLQKDKQLALDLFNEENENKD